MPINDPIRNRKVAPRSLAFERESSQIVTTYQSAGGAGTSITVVNVTGVGTAHLESRLSETMKAVRNAETRAKDWVGVYHKQWLWSANSAASLYIGGVSTLPFASESIQIMGARHYLAGGINSADTWAWRCAPGQEGIYVIGAHVKIAMTEAMAISRAKLGVYKNTSLWMYIDDLWVSDAGELPILNVKLAGTTMIDVRSGDVIQFVLFTTSGAGSGLQSFSYPTSYEGYCWGHRVQCDALTWKQANPDENDDYTVAT